MKKKKKPTMKWEDAPDTIGIEELMELLGIGKGQASTIFNTRGFPKIPEAGLKADKEAARLYLQGFKIKENPKGTMDFMILLELRKITEQMQINKGGNESENN